MKIAIHKSKDIYSERWIKYCEDNNIDYKIVNAYDTDIIQQVSDCDAFMWHHSHINYKDTLFAKQLLYSLEISGKKVFPNWRTGWHFDDKLGQKYLLEAIGEPLVPSYVFFTQKEALEWIENTSFPKVFKLRRGSGASNVKLVTNKKEAIRLVNKAFGCGFSQWDSINNLKERWRKYKHNQTNIKEIFKGIIRIFYKTEFEKMHSYEKGYVYFQDFIDNNQFDIRVIVIGHRAIGEKRICREGDFRASGSGNFEYIQIREDVLRIAFDTVYKLGLQSAAFDFIFENNKPLIIELSYAFGTTGISHCKGYYTSDLQWHPEIEPNFYGWMVEEVINNTI